MANRLIVIQVAIRMELLSSPASLVITSIIHLWELDSDSVVTFICSGAGFRLFVLLLIPFCVRSNVHHFVLSITSYELWYTAQTVPLWSRVPLVLSWHSGCQTPVSASTLQTTLLMPKQLPLLESTCRTCFPARTSLYLFLKSQKLKTKNPGNLR